MPNFDSITKDLIYSLKNFSLSQEQVQTSIQTFFDALPSIAKSEGNNAITTLAECFFLEEESRSTLAMFICGNLIEKGYDSALASERIIEKIAYLTETAYPFYSVFQEEYYKLQSLNDTEDETDDFELLETLKEKLRDEMSDAIISWESLEEQYTPTVSVFSIDYQALAKAKSQIKHINEFAEYNHGCFWLDTLFNVLFDEPVLVIEPSNDLGFIGRLNGIVDNFQLQALLMDVFPKTIWQTSRISSQQAKVFKGTGPQTMEGSLIGHWNLYNWTAITDKLSLPSTKDYESSKDWIWGEGKPADISLFKGYRVILLGKPSYSREISLQRTFSYLNASIEIERKLDKAEIKNWLSQMIEQKKVL